MRRPITLALFVLPVLLILGWPVSAQQPCHPPTLDRAAQGRNMFTDQQEMDLGDAVYERARREFKVIEDPAVTGYLQSIADRLIRNLPPTQIKFRLYLIDLPDANALTLPGGRIFVSRKMVAFVKNEDELAGLIGHELGHAYAHHSAVDFSVSFRTLLHVNTVTDRQDIFAKYNELIDAELRRGNGTSKVTDHEDDQQGAADLFGLYAVALAGYDPAAEAELWERYSETTGDPSGLLTRIFGSVSDDKKRAVALRKQLARVPRECVKNTAANASIPTDAFVVWQRSVVEFRASAPELFAPKLLTRQELTTPLQNEIRRARFSPDGRYLLAQDDGGITVLDRERWSTLFHIDQPNVVNVHFTPDSRGVVFQTEDLRVERWEIASRKMVLASEIYARNGCIQAELSPAGDLLGCLDSEYGLSLIEVATGNVLFEKENFHDPYRWYYLSSMWTPTRLIMGPGWPEWTDPIQMRFSPDGHYFVAGESSETTDALAVEVATKQRILLNDTLKHSLAKGFAFIGNAKIVSLGRSDTPGRVLTFPGGQLIEKMDIPAERIYPATKGEWVILPSLIDNHISRIAIDRTRDVPTVAVTKRDSSTTWRCAFDLAAHKVSSLPGQICLDVYQGAILAQAPNGRLGIYDLKGAPPKLVKVDAAKYTHITAAYVTPDLKWLAIANATQGGVWNLETGERTLYLPSFQAGHFTDGGKFNARFETSAAITRSTKQYDLGTRQIVDLPEVKGGGTKYFGSIVANWINEGREPTKINVLDADTTKPLWSVEGLEFPSFIYEVPNSELMVIQCPVESDFARKEIDGDPWLKRRLNALSTRKQVALLVVVEQRTGRRLGNIFAKMGSGRSTAPSLFPAGDQIIVSDMINRVTVHSLSTGEEKAAFFGRTACVNAVGSMAGVENADGDLTLYDLSTYQPREHYRFPAKIATARFSDDGNKLFVLTQDQTAYVIDTSALAGP
jgi:WD40 repeat protein